MKDIITAIDAELARLKAARAALASVGTTAPATKTKKKRNLTAEGRQRIAEAVRRRWAKEKAAAKKKKTAS